MTEPNLIFVLCIVTLTSVLAGAIYQRRRARKAQEEDVHSAWAPRVEEGRPTR